MAKKDVRKPSATKYVNNLVVIADLHCGDRGGLCPASPIPLDQGGLYIPSDAQKLVWAYWLEFWNTWIPSVCHGEPFAVVVLGDAVEGRKHGINQISQNVADQLRIAEAVLTPVVQACQGRFYIVRGTEAHSGLSSEQEEELGRRLGAVPDEAGHHSRFMLNIVLGGKCRVNLAHHIGIAGAQHYETSAILKELIELYVDAARWGTDPPDVVVRAHRHRCCEVKIPTSRNYGISFVVPGWQLNTPFSYKIPGGRIASPQIGGSVIRQGDVDFYTRHYVRAAPRASVVEL